MSDADLELKFGADASEAAAAAQHHGGDRIKDAGTSMPIATTLERARTAGAQAVAALSLQLRRYQGGRLVAMFSIELFGLRVCAGTECHPVELKEAYPMRPPRFAAAEAEEAAMGSVCPFQFGDRRHRVELAPAVAAMAEAWED